MLHNIITIIAALQLLVTSQTLNMNKGVIKCFMSGSKSNERCMLNLRSVTEDLKNSPECYTLSVTQQL